MKLKIVVKFFLHNFLQGREGEKCIVMNFCVHEAFNLGIIIYELQVCL